MVKYEDECCGCAVPAYPCLGDSCPNRHVPHLYCDKCGNDVEELYYDEDKEVCEWCLKDHLICRSLDDFD